MFQSIIILVQFRIANSDPLADFRALEQPYMVVARGKVYDHPQIKKYPACDAELDKYYD